jgi:hypothetical protein
MEMKIRPAIAAKMNTIQIFLILIILSFGGSQIGFSQEPVDSLQVVADSINNVELDNFNLKLAEIEQQRIADSLKRVDLEA